LKQIGHAMGLYEGDNRDYAPPRTIASADPAAGWAGPPHYPAYARAMWTDQIILGQYVGMTNGDNSDPKYFYGTVTRKSPFVCPSDAFHPVADEMAPSYAMGPNFVNVSASKRYKNLWKTTKLENHWTEMAVVDGFDISFEPGGWNPPYAFLGSPDTTQNRNYNITPDPNSLYNWAKRHAGGGANVLFLDGHAVTLPDLKAAYDRKELTMNVVFE
jgi:prepilin-type processing-associated H-X9-DG protein